MSKKMMNTSKEYSDDDEHMLEVNSQCNQGTIQKSYVHQVFIESHKSVFMDMKNHIHMLT